MVDDQPGKLLTYRAILEDLGENLISALQEGGFGLLLQRDVAIILMDVSMPELDGFELADLIRQHPRFQKTAIIFISAVHLTDIDRVKGYQRGAMDTSPFLLSRGLASQGNRICRPVPEDTRIGTAESRAGAAGAGAHRTVAGKRRARAPAQRTTAAASRRTRNHHEGFARRRFCCHDPHGHFVTENAALKQLLEPERLESQAPDDNQSGHAAYEIYYDGERLPVNELPLQRAAATGKPVGRIELEIRPRAGVCCKPDERESAVR